MAGVDAFGTEWAMHDGASTYVAVAEVTSISVLDVSVDSIDVSSHDSAGQWREFVAGMKDGGELSMDINYDPSLHGAIWSALGATRNHRITLTDTGAATVSFSGFISGIKADAPYDDKLAATVSIKVDGAVTITP